MRANGNRVGAIGDDYTTGEDKELTSDVGQRSLCTLRPIASGVKSSKIGYHVLGNRVSLILEW